MDSINKNQPEENHKDLSREEALVKIKDLIEQSENCFFVTSSATGPSKGVRPMSIQKTDDQGVLWILIANDSHTYQEVSADPAVKLYFQGSKHSDFLHLTGSAKLGSDKAKIKELWNPILKTWFTEGVDDPRIAVLSVEPNEGYYWDNKHGNLVAGIKMAIGATIGKTLDDSVEGTIKV